jgi:hypothetical protein
MSAIETLEGRTLLAGVTILAHGLQGSVEGWIESAADAINARLGGEGSTYVLRVGEVTRGELAVESFALESGPAASSSSRAEYIIKLDWTDVDGGAYSTAEVGAVVADYLLTYRDGQRALVELPMHLIGHSRGASLTTDIAQRLGERGVWVDQVTHLDPHPVDGDDDFLDFDFDDTPMHTWDNITFADNYWRTDGEVNNFDFDGEPVAGAHEGDLNGSVQQDFTGSAHFAVTAYYHGTIDLAATGNGNHPVNDDWYGNPPRDATGYALARLGGTPRPTDGLRAEFGGAAPREDPGRSGAQWPNIADVQVLGSTTIVIGDKIPLRYKRQDHDGNLKVDLFLDRDQNPFNENNVRAISRVSYPADPGFIVTRVNGSSLDIEPGRYWVMAKVSDDGGRTSFAYSRRITFNAPPGTSAMMAVANPFARSLPQSSECDDERIPHIEELVDV